MNQPLQTELTNIRRPADVILGGLVGVSTSLKGGRDDGIKSASRELLRLILNRVNSVTGNVALYDLREHRFPFFNGRAPEDYGSSAVALATECVMHARALFLSIPVYWSGVSGVFKNFIDVLSGPDYSSTTLPRRVWQGKPVGLLVVGSGEDSSAEGARQACAIMTNVGARLIDEPIIVSVSHSTGEVDPLEFGRAIAIAAELSKHCLRRTRGETEH